MKPETYVQFQGEFMLPLRLAEALGELVPLTAKYESGPGYVYSLSTDQKVSVNLLTRDMVAGMIAADKLK
jgi:hypothetical protein